MTVKDEELLASLGYKQGDYLEVFVHYICFTERFYDKNSRERLLLSRSLDWASAS